MNVLQRMREVISRFGDRPFLIEVSTGRRFSYAELERAAHALAVSLGRQGIRRGDRVAILLNNSAEFTILYFACLVMGVVAIPINPALHPKEIDFILNHCGAASLVCSPATQNLIFPERQDRLLYLLPLAEAERLDRRSAPPPAELVLQLEHAGSQENGETFAGLNPENFFTIHFTSGTTNRPKGVTHRIRGLLQSAVVFNEELEFGPSNRFLHVLPMAYMAGFLNTLLCPLMAGSSVVLAQPFDAESILRFWDPVIQYQPDIFWLTPSILTALLRIDRGQAGADYLRRHAKSVCVGTAPLPLKIKEEFEAKYGVELFESYGLSELLFVSANSDRFPRVDGSVGRVLPGTEIRIADEQEGMDVPPGENGEIWVKTPDSIMAGYLNSETLQPDAIDPEDWFPTGDIGYLSPDDHLFITGRKKDLIIRGGINISPRAVAELLLQHEAIEQVAVVGLPHDFYGEEVVAAVKLNRGYHLEAIRPELDAFCKANLSPFAVPTRYFAMDALPASTTGKVQNDILRDLLLAKAGAWQAEGKLP